jgi:hypothetical protein
MYQNSWDMEIHARDLRERRMRHAARMQQLDAADRGRRMQSIGIAARISAVIARAGNFLARAARADLARRSARHGENGARSLPTARSKAHYTAAAPRRQPGPFADMVVIARGSPARNPKQVER